MKSLLILTQLLLIVYAEKKPDSDKVIPQKVPLSQSSIENPDFVTDRLINAEKKPDSDKVIPLKVSLLSKPSIENPNFVRDRLRNIIKKPEMPPTWTNRFQQPFDPAWMDYCDPYHCNDYHRIACGLHRKKMKFKWFQSRCHLIVNNQCSNFRGNLKYDIIENKYCTAYVMFLRSGCPSYADCDDHKLHPLCAMSSKDGHVVLFKNKCFLDAVNCLNSTLQEYDEVKMSICEKALYYDYEPEVVREVREPVMSEKFLVNLGEGK